MLHKIIKAQGGIVHYFTNNIENRTTLFFCHGLTADHTIFEKQYEYFKDKYNLILLDIPMHGLSYPYKNFSYKDCADIIHSILIKENIDEVIMLGMSMGGYPCQFFAHYYPDSVIGFVAIDTTPLGLKYYSKSDVFWLRQVKPMAKLFSEKLLKKEMAKSISETEYSYNTMMKIYNKADKGEALNAVISDKIIENMLNTIGDKEYVVIVSKPYYNMGNYEKMDKFLKKCTDGKKESIVLYRIQSEGGIGREEYSCDGTNMYILNTIASWSDNNKPIISYTTYNRIKKWKYTEKGWFCYEVCVREPP